MALNNIRKLYAVTVGESSLQLTKAAVIKFNLWAYILNKKLCEIEMAT